MATTTTEQQGDVHFFQTLDGGEIRIVNGITEMCPGLEVAAYLSLFGGNEQDDGNIDNPLQYWGNRIEPQTELHLRSRTQYLLRNIPATSGNLLRIQEAVLLDLAWLRTSNIVNDISASVTVPTLNRVRIDIALSAQGDESNFTFTENWKASV